MEIGSLLPNFARTTRAFSGKATASPLSSGSMNSGGIMSEEEFRKFVEKGQAEVKAAQKIEDAKKELEFLKRAGFPPKVLARLAAELLGKVQKAAGEFETAMGGAGGIPAAGGATGDVSAAANTIAPTAVIDSGIAQSGADAQSAGGALGDDGASGSVDEKTARSAYQSVLDDAAAPADPEEGKIKSKFAALIAELKQLIKKAEQDDRAERQGQ